MAPVRSSLDKVSDLLSLSPLGSTDSHHHHHHDHQHNQNQMAIKQKQRQLGISLEAMIQRNLSSDALRPLITYQNSTSSESLSGSEASTPSRVTGCSGSSNGPDSPYSRLSRNLSQLLDEEDAQMDAKLLSNLGNAKQHNLTNTLNHNSNHNMTILSPPVFEPSVIHQGEAVARVGFTSSPRTVTVSIAMTCDGEATNCNSGWGEQDFEEMMTLLAACGHLVLSFVVVSLDKAMLEFGTSEEAMQVQSLVDGYVLQGSGRMMKAVHHNGYSKGHLSHNHNTNTKDGKPLRPAVSRSIWVGHVGPEVTDDMIKRVFEVHGPVEVVKRVEGRACAFVNFCHVEHAIIARKALNNSRLGTGIIKTGFAKSTTGSPTELTSDFTASQLDSPRTISYCESTGQSDSNHSDRFNSPIPSLPEPTVHFDDLKEIRIELEHQANDFVDSIYCRFRDHLTILAMDAMGNIVVQKLLERGDLSRRLEICDSFAPHLAALSCHKNGTWVVQKFIALASNSTDSRDLRQLLMSSLEPYLVEMLKDQFGNYVVQGCLGLGQCARVLLECLQWRGVELAKSRFGARAMKSLLEPMSSRHYDLQYYKMIVQTIRDNIVELVVNPHGALLLSYLMSVDQLDGSAVIEACLAATLHTSTTALLLNRHAVSVLQEACARASPSATLALAAAIADHDNPLRLVNDQGAVSLICACMTVNAGGDGKRMLAARFGPVVSKAHVHSDQHAHHLAIISSAWHQ